MPTKTLDRPLDVRAAGVLPQIEPIALATRADAFDDPEWLFEPKYDGIRGLVCGSKLGCEVRFRRDFRFDGSDELCNRVARVLGAREVILDGEIVALDRKGKPVFRDLLRGEGFLAFAAFDLLWLDGDDLRVVDDAVDKRGGAARIGEESRAPPRLGASIRGCVGAVRCEISGGVRAHGRAAGGGEAAGAAH